MCTLITFSFVANGRQNIDFIVADMFFVLFLLLRFFVDMLLFLALLGFCLHLFNKLIKILGYRDYFEIWCVTDDLIDLIHFLI